MKKIVKVFLLIGSASVAALSLPSFANTAPDFPFIVVNGQASVAVTPDKAKISLNILSVDRQSKQALETVALRGREMVKLALKFGIDQTKIKSFSLSKRIIRDKTRGYQQGEISGYEVSQRFVLELSDIINYSELMDGLVAMNNVNNVQISFDVSTRAKITSNLVKQAGEDAKTKAQDLAAGLGAKLGRVFAASTDANFSSYMATFGLNEQSMPRMEAMSFKAGQYNLFVPETIDISQSINVVYRLK